MTKKLKNKNILKVAAMILAMSVLGVNLVACGNASKEEAATSSAEEEITKYIQDKYELERGHFYLQTPEGYIEPYTGPDNQSEKDKKKKDEENISTISDDIIEDSILWLKDDFEEIPTLYKGEKLVYRTSSSFNENFNFNRFFDGGWTVGLGLLEGTQTGRYQFTGNSSTQVCSFSDAHKFTELGDVKVTIDAIGGLPLRGDMINPSVNIITGLEKDKSYDVDIYMGTELQPYNGAETQSYTVNADVRALYFVQTNSTDDYEFTRSDIIEISIPEWFNSGYYVINNYGIFRYVNGDSYDENTDFNIMNAKDETEANRLANLPENSVNWTEQLDIPEDGSWVINFSYSDDINTALLDGEDPDMVSEPYIKIDIANDTSYRFEDEYLEGNITGTFNAPVGTYSMTIYNLYGRSFEYELSYNDEVYDKIQSEDIEEVTTPETETTNVQEPPIAAMPDNAAPSLDTGL